MSWQEKYGIKMIQSEQRAEAVVYHCGEVIPASDTPPGELTVVEHKTFAFATRDMSSPTDGQAQKCFEYIEKAYLLWLLDVPVETNVLQFICPEGGEVLPVTQEFLEDLDTTELDKLLPEALTGKDVFFFNRSDIKMKRREGWEFRDLTFLAWKRFNYLVFDKEEDSQ